LFYVGVVLVLGAATVGMLVVSDPLTIPRVALAGAWALSVVGIVLTTADQRAVAQTTLSNLLGSSTGHKLTTQAIAVGLAGLAVAWAGTRRTRPALAVLGGAAAAVMLARALAGHADASTVRWFTVGTQWIHLVSVGAWVGGLVWLLVAMRKGDPGQGRGLARRFSTVAAWTLVVVAASGTVRAIDEVGAWGRLLHTSFGQALLVKLAFFAALVGLGALSRYRHVPAATAGGRWHGLRRVVRGEVAIGAGVLGATAVLAGLPPSALVAAASKPAPTPTVTVTGNDYATSVRVRLVVTPGLPGPNRFDATVADYDSGQPLAAQTVQLRFQASDHPDVAPATLDLARDASGRWWGFGRGLSIAGRWSVTAVVQTAADAVEVPMELQTRQPVTGSTGTGNDAAGECGEGEPDPSYAVSTDFDPDPPRAEGTVLHMTVRHDGKPVTGAKVCVVADMPDMQHPGVSGVAKEGPGGRYDTTFKFSMGGTWAAAIRIVEPGKPVVLVTLRFDVK
jgi:copper transport protein